MPRYCVSRETVNWARVGIHVSNDWLKSISAKRIHEVLLPPADLGEHRADGSRLRERMQDRERVGRGV